MVHKIAGRGSTIFVYPTENRILRFFIDSHIPRKNEYVENDFSESFISGDKTKNVKILH